MQERIFGYTARASVTAATATSLWRSRGEGGREGEDVEEEATTTAAGKKANWKEAFLLVIVFIMKPAYV